MEIYHPKREFKPKFDYYFYDAVGKLSVFKSEEELHVGVVVVVESFFSKYTMRITRTWQEGDKEYIEWESFKVVIGDTKPVKK